MFFVPVSWPDYEMACLTPSGRAAIGVTVLKRVRLLARHDPGHPWHIVREWSVERLSHTEIIIRLGAHPEPESPEEILSLIEPLEHQPTDPPADT